MSEAIAFIAGLFAMMVVWFINDNSPRTSPYRRGFEDGKAQREHDDKIEVGDEVKWDNDFTGDRFIVTRIYQPYGKKEQCDGIGDDGDVYRAVLIESLVKTGRHFDIASILEAMKHD